jgi:hypothetical protein
MHNVGIFFYMKSHGLMFDSFDSNILFLLSFDVGIPTTHGMAQPWAIKIF